MGDSGAKINVLNMQRKLADVTDPNLLWALCEVLDSVNHLKRHRKNGKVQVDVMQGVAVEVYPRVKYEAA